MSCRGICLLLIDDDIEFCEFLTEYLENEGFEVTAVHDGKEGLEKAVAGNDAYDLIILDLMLPGMNGFEVLQRLRSELDTPVLMYTGRDEEVDRVIGLEIGADDFIVKSSNPRELVARIRAILRRTGNRSAQSGQPGRKPLVVGDLELDAGTRVVHLNGEKLDLTSVEFNLLQVMVQAAGKVVTREHLALQGMGRGLVGYDRSLDVHVSRLRKKLGYKLNGVERIKTVRSVGYVYTLAGDPPRSDPACSIGTSRNGGAKGHGSRCTGI